MGVETGYCLIQAILDASAYTRRALDAQRLQTLYSLVDQHGGYPADHLQELLDLLIDLEPFVVVHGRAYVSPSLPCIAITKSDAHAHAEFHTRYADISTKPDMLIVFTQKFET